MNVTEDEERGRRKKQIKRFDKKQDTRKMTERDQKQTQVRKRRMNEKNL